jgi:hypothetical protein
MISVSHWGMHPFPWAEWRGNVSEFYHLDYYDSIYLHGRQTHHINV